MRTAPPLRIQSESLSPANRASGHRLSADFAETVEWGWATAVLDHNIKRLRINLKPIFLFSTNEFIKYYRYLCSGL